MESFHGTTAERATSILNDNFKFQDFNRTIHNKKMVCDLGCGVYTFCEDELGVSIPNQMALDYAKQYKSKLSPTKIFNVIKVDIKDTDDISVLDLDKPENMKTIRIAKKNLQQRIDSIYRSIADGYSKVRANQDGILIELAINQNIFSNPDVLVKETHTSLGDTRTISSIPNGRELVIRNLDVIDSKIKI